MKIIKEQKKELKNLSTEIYPNGERDKSELMNYLEKNGKILELRDSGFKTGVWSIQCEDGQLYVYHRELTGKILVTTNVDKVMKIYNQNILHHI